MAIDRGSLAESDAPRAEPRPEESETPQKTKNGLMPEETRRYLVIVSVSDVTPQRLSVVAPWVKDILARLSTDAPELAFRSVASDIFGYFIRSTLAAGQINARLESPGRGAPYSAASQQEPPVLSGEDSLFIIEIGDDFNAGRGFTRAGTWLQRH